MNILILSPDFPPLGGGIANFVQNIANELVSRGHKITVLSEKRGFNDIEADSKQGFLIYRYKNLPRLSSSWAIAKTLYCSFIRKSAVIFLGSFLSTHGVGAILAQYLLGIPYVILVHGNEMNYFFKLSRIDRWVSNQLLQNANFIFVNSLVTKQLVESYGYPEKSISIVHPGIDQKKFMPKPKDLKIIKKYGLQNKKILLTASRLVPLKNHENVLKALPTVIEKVPDLVYLIIGKGVAEKRLATLTKDLDLGEFVKFVGYVEPDKISFYFNICDVFIMPSKKLGYEYESFGIAFLEANACGKPAIGSRVGGIKEAVIDGETGVLVDPENVAEISNAILRLLTDKEYSKMLGEKGRKRVEKEFTWKNMANKLNNHLLHLIISPRSKE